LTQKKLSLVPKLSLQEHEDFKRMLTMHYISTSTSFSRVECPYLEKALKILRPDISIPSRRQMSTSLLDDVYHSLSDEAHRFMKRPSTIG
jgi:hypothetical protein